MNNSPNNGNGTYNPDFNENAGQNPAPQRRSSGQGNRPPLMEEERRRIAAARAAGMRANNGNPNPGNGQIQRRPAEPNANGQPRPNPNGRPQNMQVPNQAQRRPQNGQPHPQRPQDPYAGRRRKRRVRINAGAVIFVLLIGAVIGVSAYQISKNPDTVENTDSQAQYENVIEQAQSGVSAETVTDAGESSSSAEEVSGYETVAVQTSTVSEGELVLVNFNYAYDRIDDVELTNAYTERTGKIKVSSTTLGMDPEAFAALEELVAGLVADTGCDDLLLYSGHRTLADQQRIWDSNMTNYGEEYTKTYVAVPGHSEHHTGYACDLGFYTDEGASVPLVDHEYGTWVWDHCTEYGYILRYPEEKADLTGIGHEQWHFRYVGLAHAYAIDSLGLCLEEYLDALKGYTAETKMLHISADRELTDVNAEEIGTVSGGWLTYYVPASDAETTEIPVPRGDKYADYEISGNNVDGFIVTITLG